MLAACCFMDVWQYFCRRLWVLALWGMIVFVVVDTVIHLGTTYTVSTQHLYLPPVADESSPTGYELGQRDEILPYVGMDGYHWVMQTQDALAKGEARVRWVDYDNYQAKQPSGREVHWSSSFRWWLELLAGIEHLFGGIALPYAVEQVLPFANTLLIVFLVILLAPGLAQRFGSAITALLLTGMGAIGPVYESFSEGKSDHHGLASLSSMLTLLFLLGGAAGWVRTDNRAAAKSPLRAWMPTRGQCLVGLGIAVLVYILGLWTLAASNSTKFASDLVTIALLNVVLALFLWLRAGHAATQETEDVVDSPAASAPVPGKTQTAQPPLLGWLPRPHRETTMVFFICSAMAGVAGIAYCVLTFNSPAFVKWLSPAATTLLLPEIEGFLIVLLLANVLAALLLLAKCDPLPPEGKDTPETAAGPRLLAWLPNRSQARHWFIASGIAGGVGLWVSTASEAPVLAEVGLGALLATGLFARNETDQSWAKADPSLWRVWGWSGAATSIFFYLVEYFPSHFGMRLEVNHPLYALAWAGGGEIIYRVCRWLGGGKLAEQPRDWAWLAGSAIAILIVPAIIYLFADQVFWIASWTNNSKFLFIFHEDYIAEFKDMRRYVDAMYAGPAASYAISVINPLVLLALPMLAWVWGGLRRVLFVLLLIGLVVFDLFLVSYHDYIYHQTVYPVDYYAWLLFAGPLVVFILLLCLWEPWPKFPQPCRALLVLPLPGGLLTMFLSLREMRWMEIGYSFWLAAAAGVFLALRLHAGFRWTVARMAGVGFFLAAVLIPNPLITFIDWYRWHGTVPMSDVELMEIVTRDAAQRLRARLGSDIGVTVSGPTTTTWMTYWGGLKGLGTLYWENLDGLKADMAVYSAPSAEEAYAQIKKYGVTHIAIYSWDPFYKEYARLSKNMHRPITDAEYMAEAPLRGWLGSWLPMAVNHPDEVAAEIPKIQNAFIYDLIEHRNIPTWLRPVYYPMPGDPIMRGQYVTIYEVAPRQTPQEALVRDAQRYQAAGDLNTAVSRVKDALQIDPNYLPALICGARVLNLAGNSQAFASVMQSVHKNIAQAEALALDDRIELIIALVLNNDMADSTAQINAAMKAATTHDVRRLTAEQLYNFVSFLRQVGLINTRPGLAGFIESHLMLSQRAEFMVESANAEKKAGHLAQALSYYRRAHELLPNALPGLLNLADFLATTHDDSLRNGREAVVLALQAHEIDHGQHADVLDVLGCAYAEARQFTLAVTVEQLAIDLAEAQHDGNHSTQYRARLAAFRNSQPYHE